jgi:hypothetical protein
MDLQKICNKSRKCDNGATCVPLCYRVLSLTYSCRDLQLQLPVQWQLHCYSYSYSYSSRVTVKVPRRLPRSYIYCYCYVLQFSLFSLSSQLRCDCPQSALRSPHSELRRVCTGLVGKHSEESAQSAVRTRFRSPHIKDSKQLVLPGSVSTGTGATLVVVHQKKYYEYKTTRIVGTTGNYRYNVLWCKY